MTIKEICNKYIKVKTTGIPTLHQHPKFDWAFKTVLGTMKKRKMNNYLWTQVLK